MRHLGWAIITAGVLGWCCQHSWSGGGTFSASGHGSRPTGVNRLPALYPQGDCGHCHEAHASQDTDPTLYPYALFAREENVCWACHDGSVTYAADVKVPFSLPPPNTATDYYKHPLSDLYTGFTPSAHRAGESDQAAFSGASRHAECTDCHNPHTAANDGTPGSSTHTPGGTTGNLISGALLGATGISVTAWQAAGQPFSSASHTLRVLNSASTDQEWQICFKCHSSFAALPTYAAVGSGDFLANKITSNNPEQAREYQDVGQAFNPNNLSYHPVTAQGRNTSIPLGSFVSPWSATSTMYCSDCHNKAEGAEGGAGPHGSSNMHILERPFYLQENTHYYDPSRGKNVGHDPSELCFKCHRWQTYMAKMGMSGADPATNTGFRDRQKNLHTRHLGNWARGSTCYTCHDIHGTNKEHLINFNMDHITASSGSQDAYVHKSDGGECYLTCHGKRHNPKRYRR